MGPKSGSIMLASVILLGASAAGVVKATWSGDSAPLAHHQKGVASKHSTPPFATVHVTTVAHLPVAKEGLSLAINDKNVYSIGGYTGTYSTSSVFQMTPAVVQVATLPEPNHDAAAGFIHHHLYVFGGGQAASYPYITRVDGSTAAHIGNLSRPLSDATAVLLNVSGQEGLAVVGGYDGSVFNTAVRFYTETTTGNLKSIPLFQLHTGVRYAAVAASAQQVLIAGGLTMSGALSDTISEWTPAHGLQIVGKLPMGIQKAAGYIWRNNLIIAGGYDNNNDPQQAIWDFNTVTHKLRQIGKLPVSVADMGYTEQGDTGYLAGGSTANGLSGTLYQLRFH